MSNRIVRWLFWPTAVILVLGTTFLLWYNSQPRLRSSIVNAAGHHDPNASDDDERGPPPDTTNVKVIRPRSGAMERITVQVGSVLADEVDLYAQVTGVLLAQTVDIGDRVKTGKMLAAIEVPELEKQVQKNAASVEQAKARVEQMKAKVEVAKADLGAANANIVYSEAFARSATAWVVYRNMKFKRMQYLAAKTAVEGALEDEAKEQYEAAKESENAAKAAIVTSKAKASSVEAQVRLADADVVEAKAQVKIAEAELAKSQEQLRFAQILAPFDGIITHRTLVPGGMVRSVGQGGASLLTIQRTDRMRVIVQIPDRDVPYADPGDIAYVEIDAFPGVKFDAKISRIAKTEDPLTRLMPVEIDLPNPQGKIRQGMFGKVTIILDKSTDQLSIPSSCLAGKSRTRAGTVFVERDGKAYRTKIKLGMDDGARVEVLQGLKSSDRVILAPPTGLRDGMEVQATFFDETELRDDNVP